MHNTLHILHPEAAFCLGFQEKPRSKSRILGNIFPSALEIRCLLRQRTSCRHLEQRHQEEDQSSPDCRDQNPQEFGDAAIGQASEVCQWWQAENLCAVWSWASSRHHRRPLVSEFWPAVSGDICTAKDEVLVAHAKGGCLKMAFAKFWTPKRPGSGLSSYLRSCVWQRRSAQPKFCQALKANWPPWTKSHMSLEPFNLEATVQHFGCRFQGQELDVEFIDTLKRQCTRYISERGPATALQLQQFIENSVQQIIPASFEVL